MVSLLLLYHSVLSSNTVHVHPGWPVLPTLPFLCLYSVGYSIQTKTKQKQKQIQGIWERIGTFVPNSWEVARLSNCSVKRSVFTSRRNLRYRVIEWTTVKKKKGSHGSMPIFECQVFLEELRPTTV